MANSPADTYSTHTDHPGKDAQSVDYARLVTVLIEAVKEQQQQIDTLKETVARLQQQHFMGEAP